MKTDVQILKRNEISSDVFIIAPSHHDNFNHIAVEDGFVAHATVDALIKRYGFDKESIVKNIMENHNG